MHSSVRTIGSIGAILLLVLGLATALQAQDWIARDVFLGNTGGKVVVFRPSTNSVVGTPLSDGVINPGPITSLFIDNTWHPVAADSGTSSNQSKIVRFKILPDPTTQVHGVLSTLDGSLCNSSSNIQSIAIAGNGDILAGNTNPPTFVKLSPTGVCLATASSLPVSSIGSIDLNTVGDLAYFTSGDGTIRTIPVDPLTSTVSTFLSFNGPVNLFDLRVVPAGALQGNCGTGITCPTAESLLVVAQGNTNFCTGFNGVSAKSCVLLIDTSTKAVVAKYTISGQNGLQSLTLDPIVTDCTGQNCITAKLNAFWVAGPSNQFFSVDVGLGTPSPYSVPSTPANPVIISSLFVYSGFGANQSIPTKFSDVLTPTDNSAPFTFDSNTLTISQIPAPSSTTTKLDVFAGTIDPDGGANDAGQPGQPCTATAGADCVYWEVESTPQDASLTFHLSAPGLDNNSRGFRDEVTDTTISLDLLSTGKNSLYTYNQIDGPDKGCHYVPTTQLFDGATINANRNSITFRFQCAGLSGAALQTLAPPAPRISIVQFVPGQNPVPFFPDFATLVGGTCCTKSDYRYDTSANQWIINVSFKGVLAGTRFNATTFIDSQKARAFDINFTYGGSSN